MSKLLDKLDKASQLPPRRMGFVSSTTESASPPLVLIVRVDASSKVSIKDTSEHADSIIVRVAEVKDAESLSKQLAKLPDTLGWGVQAEVIKADQVGGLTENGCDFIVLRVEGTPVSVLNEENVTKVLSVDDDMEEQFLRVLEDVPTDSLLIETQPKEGLTIKDLMSYRSVLSCVSKPVMVCISANLTEGELTALQNVGVIGVLVDAKTAKDVKQLAGLRKVIEALPPREDGDRRRVESLATKLGSGVGQSISDPDDDE